MVGLSHGHLVFAVGQLQTNDVMCHDVMSENIMYDDDDDDDDDVCVCVRPCVRPSVRGWVGVITCFQFADGTALHRDVTRVISPHHASHTRCHNATRMLHLPRWHEARQGHFPLGQAKLHGTATSPT